MTNATSSVHSSVGGDDNENIITTSANVIATAVLPSVVIALASVVLAIPTATVSSNTHYTERTTGPSWLIDLCLVIDGVSIYA